MRRCRRRNCWPCQSARGQRRRHICNLWSTKADLPDAFKLMERWQFKYITTLTWIRSTFGLGSYFRTSTEHVLFGVICSVRGPSGGTTRRVLKTSGEFLTVSEIRASLVVSAPKRASAIPLPHTVQPGLRFRAKTSR
jgi:N6-adenosine-specific RNA methylase IME4